MESVIEAFALFYFLYLWVVGLLYTIELINKEPGYGVQTKLIARLLTCVMAFVFQPLYMVLGIVATAHITTYLQTRGKKQ